MTKNQTTICNPPATWWHVQYWNYKSTINPVTVTRFSPSSVWVLRPTKSDPNREQRHKIVCSGDAYFPTKQEAEASLVAYFQQKIDSAHRSIEGLHASIALMTEHLNSLSSHNQQTPEAA